MVKIVNDLEDHLRDLEFFSTKVGMQVNMRKT